MGVRSREQRELREVVCDSKSHSTLLGKSVDWQREGKGLDTACLMQEQSPLAS